MSAQSLIDQLLQSGQGLLQGKHGEAPDWRQLGTGAVAGGVLGLLLGSRRGRSMGAKALKYGSVAALGYAAYRAYQDWQARQQAPAASLPASQWLATRDGGAPTLPAPQAEQHSRALLQAMIGAAKADGHLDARERGLIDAELARQQADPAERQWVEQELGRPVDPAEVARAAATPALAAEMYLASLLLADQTSYMERAYLDELARQMKLPDGLRRELEAQAA